MKIAGQILESSEGPRLVESRAGRFDQVAYSGVPAGVRGSGMRVAWPE